MLYGCVDVILIFLLFWFSLWELVKHIWLDSVFCLGWFSFARLRSRSVGGQAVGWWSLVVWRSWFCHGASIWFSRFCCYMVVDVYLLARRSSLITFQVGSIRFSLFWVVRDSLPDLVAKVVYHYIGSLSSCFFGFVEIRKVQSFWLCEHCAGEFRVMFIRLNWDWMARNGRVFVVCHNELLACKIVTVLAVKVIRHNQEESKYNVIFTLVNLDCFVWKQFWTWHIRRFTLRRSSFSSDAQPTVVVILKVVVVLQGLIKDALLCWSRCFWMVVVIVPAPEGGSYLACVHSPRSRPLFKRLI